MKREHFIFKTPKMQLKRINLRTKVHDVIKDEEYAVLTVAYHDAFDGHALRFKSKKIEKDITLICFKPDLYERLEEGDFFYFEGSTHYRYGGIYQRVEKILDDLGFSIDSKESIYYNANKVIPIEEFLGGGTTKHENTTPKKIPAEMCYHGEIQ